MEISRSTSFHFMDEVEVVCATPIKGSRQISNNEKYALISRFIYNEIVFTKK